MAKHSGVGVFLRAKERGTGLALGLLAILWMMVLSSSAFAQTNFGRISGAVTDQTGAVIAGAAVTVTDTARNISRSLTTDAAGQFTAPSLTPGMYLVHAQAAGFSPAEKRDIEVPVGGDIRADLQLSAGSQTQTVTVTEQAPQINVTNATISASMESSEVTSMPVLGGQWMYLFASRPGMVSKPGGGPSATSSNGVRSEQQNFMFEGMFASQLGSGAPTLGGTNTIADQATILPLDAIQELNLVQEPKAEYGWKSGAAVDVGIKSGTNRIHGTAHAEGRDAALVARNAYTPASVPTPLNNFEQFGGSIGGPIKKDKLFYFADFEGQRYNVGLPTNTVVPTTATGSALGAAANPGQSFPDAIAGINTYLAAHPGAVNASSGGALAVSPLSAAMAGCTAGLGSTASAGITCSVASQGGNGGLFGNSESAPEVTIQNQNGGSNNGLGRIDYQVNARNSINGDLFWGGTPFEAGGKGDQPFYRPIGGSYSQIVRVAWIWAPNSNVVNSLRFGFDRNYLQSENGDCYFAHPDYAGLGFVTGVPQTPLVPFGTNEPSTCGFPTLLITSFSTVGSDTGQLEFGHYPAFTENLSLSRGKHQFMFGFEVRFQRFAGGSGFTNDPGTLAFGASAAFTGATALEDFMTGTASATGSSLLTSPSGGFQTGVADDYAGFVQDDWRVAPKLTLNLGLRYEFQQAWHATNGHWSRFDAAAPQGLLAQGPNTSVYNGSYTAGIMPRFGVAYDLTGKGVTVVRGGFGIMNSAVDYLGVSTGGRLSTNPTGGTFYAANGATTVGTGSQNTGTVSVPGTGVNGIDAQWKANNPIFGPELSATINCGNGFTPNPNPCNIYGINPNISPARVYEWNVAVQHEFSNNLSLNLAYVGNHGSGMWAVTDVNQPIAGAGYSSTSAVSANVEQAARPYYSQFPWFGTIEYINNIYQSNYAALQATLIQRLSHGLTFTGGYTLAHSLDDNTSDYAASNAQNSRAPGAQMYGNSDLDARHRGSLTLNYILLDKKSFAQMLQGWQLSSTLLLGSALPVNNPDTTSNVSGTGELYDRWTVVGNPSQFRVGGRPTTPCYGIVGSSFGGTANCIQEAALADMPANCLAAASSEAVNTTNPVLAGTTGLTSLAKYGCYMKGSAVIIPPAPGTFGTQTRNSLRATGFQEWDASLKKSWNLKEGMTAQFIFSAFNILNSVQYAPPSDEVGGAADYNPDAPSTFGQSASTPDVAQGSAVLGQGGPRKFQFGARLIF